MKKACEVCGSGACATVSKERCITTGATRMVVDAVVPAAAETTIRRTPITRTTKKVRVYE